MSNTNSSGAEVVGTLIALALAVIVVLACLALFASVGVVYGAAVSFKNYCRAFINNVALERPLP